MKCGAAAVSKVDVSVCTVRCWNSRFAYLTGQLPDETAGWGGQKTSLPTNFRKLPWRVWIQSWKAGLCCHLILKVWRNFEPLISAILAFDSRSVLASLLTLWLFDLTEISSCLAGLVSSFVLEDCLNEAHWLSIVFERECLIVRTATTFSLSILLL